MAVEWYLQDLRGQSGPFDSVELRRKLKTYTNFEHVYVWRDGFPDWKLVSEVFDFIDDIPGGKRVKWRWASYGLIIGFLICASDGFEWRGKTFLAWQGNGTAENIGYIAGTAGTLALVFLVAGLIKDWNSSRSKIRSNLGSATSEKSQAVPLKPPIYMNFVAKNWRGDYRLWVSYWIFGLIGNVAIAIVPLGLAEIFRSKSGFQPINLFAIVVGVWISIIAIAVWQWVGVWRSANNYIEQRSLQLKGAPWAGVAKIMAVLAFIQLGRSAVTFGLPQLTEVTQIAFFDDPDIPNYSIRIMRNGTEAEITGGIKYGLTSDFQKIVRASRQMKIVHLNSIGGRIGEGEKLYNLIKDSRLSTYVSARCLSACTLAFSGGNGRVLRHGATLGFHRGSFAGTDAKDSAELQGQRKIFTAAGFDSHFISRALATPSAEMWEPSESELLNAGVITGISNGSDYAASGYNEISKDSFYKSLSKARPYAAISVRFPKTFEDMVNEYYNGFVDGKTETEIGASLHDRLVKLLSAIRHLADDDVLIDLGNVLADQLAALKNQSPTACYRYAAIGVLDNSSSQIPPAIIKRELDVEDRIILTASKRPGAKEPDKDLWLKLFGRLGSKGVTKEDIDLIGQSNVAESQKGRYCSVMAALYKEIAALPQREGAMFMRSMLSDK